MDKKEINSPQLTANFLFLDLRSWRYRSGGSFRTLCLENLLRSLGWVHTNQVFGPAPERLM